MGEMSFTFPPDLEEWISTRVADGHYADASAYLHDLIRRDQEETTPESPEYIAWVREQVAIGLASEVIHRDPRDVLDEIIAERKARRG